MVVRSILRTAVIALGLAGAFALGGCAALPGQDTGEDASDARGDETHSAAGTNGAPTAPTETAGAGETAGPESDAGSEADAGAHADAGTDDPWADKAKTRSWASDASIDVDKDGNGTIPAAAIEADLVDLFANKFDLTVDEAQCEEDMEVREWDGFEACDVIAEDMTYFGTVELVGHKGSMIEYEVMFPGIDKSELDLEG